MYHGNYLAEKLRAASLGAENRQFLRNHQTGEEITYEAFFANAERMAQVLVGHGVEPNDRVAVQAPKTVAMLELYVATVLAGGVFLPLNPAYTAAEITYFLNDAEPRVLVCDPTRERELSPLAKQAGVAEVLTIGADESGTLVDLRDGVDTGFTAVSRKPDDLAAILYTSGTTGRSKGAMLTHQALASNSETLKDAWQFSADDVLIHALPIFHTHGLFVATNTTLMAGSSCIFMPSFDADEILGYMPKATVLMGVPTFYVRLLKSEDLSKAAANMRLFVSGSAPLLAETHDRWREMTGHAILERYGMTETNMNTSNPYQGDRRAGTVGFPLPGIELLVTDPATGVPLPQGETGVLEVRGPNVFAGYWNMPEKTAEELRGNGFFITGDLGHMDKDGYVHIVGRQKDLIISGGYNIYPKEIELLIDELDGINECAVIGVPHTDFGEAVVAVVVTQNGADVSTTDIMASIKGNLARFKQPKHIEFVNSLPRNAMGKVQKNVLREDYDAIFK
ncbi:malonyl-CoA synthase [Amylibacter ulvae]|uniref:Malonyl-CoA synthase n=1 Tax=Paramylibacter ulvae TaxID=1651968 RepID=A0ABQ3D833_9RHOB|nr:malonyl-CoA synthase [Amylibacter ulvae]GHA62775.1 malonyl-CoA synthase [Amylibacter ulvae]